MKPKRFSVLIIILLTLLSISPTYLYATDSNSSDELIEVTDTLAVEMAQRFFDDLSDTEIVARNPSKLFDVDEGAVGYIVCDGWGTALRYLPYTTSYYSIYDGTFFY